MELPVAGGALPRRAFLRTLGLGVGAAALDACWEPPSERILPYVHQPPEVVPGVPVAYATAMTVDGYATGLLVQTREGRPVKVEGNPLHPASLGAAGVFEQASLLGLYDASRATATVADGRPASWERIVDGLVPRTAEDGGEGLAFLLEPTTSPLRAHLLDRLLERLPRARVHFHGAVAPSPALEAFLRLEGRPLETLPDPGAARVVVALDADVLSRGPFHLRHARRFAAGRTPRGPDDVMSRLYAAEPVPSSMSVLADHHLRVRGGDVVFLLGELARAVGVEPAGLADPPERLRGERVRAFVAAAAADLLERRGEGLVLVGDAQPPAAHALAHRVNAALGNEGRTVTLVPSALARADEVPGGLARLTAALEAGAVRSLVVLECNAAHTAPADVPFADALERVERSLYLGLHRDETGARCGWFSPALHWMESWGDARAYDGTLTPVQPLVRPLHGGRTPDDVLLAWLGERDASVHGALRARWGTRWREGAGTPADDEAFDAFWDGALAAGVVEGTAATPVSASPDPAPLLAGVEPPADGVEVAFRADPRVHDGRFAGNAWLQELPDPTTKLTWGNAALLSPGLAARLGVEAGEPLAVAVDGRVATLPALPVAGHADDAVTLALGYGRAPGIGAGGGVGVDVYPLRTRDRPWHAPATVEPAPGERVELATTQPEADLHDRPIVLRHTLAAFREDPDFTRRHRGETDTLYGEPDLPRSEHQWGMTVDLSACTGCGACVVACRAENNVPVVGPADVARGRIMDWIRVDRYVAGDPDEPTAHLRQPMLCQHCEKAPCEYVCPVNATVHSADGLNEMVYNRCVGTRFCSNNCPYKVRRFNWFDYGERRPPGEALVLNPDVTVRDRGVMEKCSYCVQRIRREVREARRGGPDAGPPRPVTACQQACPAGVIVFGDLADPDSAVARTRSNPRRYEVLHELGTRPRTLYLAAITNPRPGVEP